MTKMDERAKELAKIVVEYSTEVKKGDLVWIKGAMIALPFMDEIARRVIDRGAYAALDYGNSSLERYWIDNSSMEQLLKRPGFETTRAEECDIRISIYAEENPLYLEGADPKRIAGWSKSFKQIMDIIIGDGEKHKGKRWNVVGYPTAAQAKLGGMTLNKYSDILFSATNIDWKKVSEEMKKVKDTFDDAEDVHIFVPGLTDLHLSLKGRGGYVCDGKYNMPDGEVFYGPVEDTAEGFITFTYPAIKDGNLVEGIRLDYKGGEVKKFSAKKNQKFLEAMLTLNGVKRIGELGIGCNYGIQKYMKNLLFDEKIGGTVHLAIGGAYPLPLDSGGGLNKADIHWDIVCDLRKIGRNPGGQLKVNGKLVQENGNWIL